MNSSFDVRLHSFVDEIYQRAVELDWYWEDLAKEAKLCRQTVYRLGNRETKSPRFETVYKLATAVGMEWQLQQFKKKLRRTG